ncbi:MAG TPA: AAA family ATPase [Microvirga sp.]|jgi:MoxR-like ATPase|nr:AAA family ATPase [Microvirga sp.]
MQATTQDTLDRAEPSPGAEAAIHDRIAALRRHLAAVVVDRERLVTRLLIGLLADGHLLIEGAPGLAKTRAAKGFADGLNASFARIQCTPDLMPADITGTPVWRPGSGTFEFVAGPVFHSIVLVDEINRAPPKVQSALLEAMAERQVTAGSVTYPLPDPFLVLATRNPIEQEGTYPLPEAELDRFLLHVILDLPDAPAERRILDLVERESVGGRERAPVQVEIADVKAARAAARRVHLAPALKEYIVRLVMATRDGRAGDDVRDAIAFPVSPRGTLALAAAAKALAYLDGRDHATPDDVEDLAVEALSHRLVLSWRAVAEGLTPQDLVRTLLKRVPIV